MANTCFQEEKKPFEMCGEKKSTFFWVTPSVFPKMADSFIVLTNDSPICPKRDLRVQIFHKNWISTDEMGLINPIGKGLIYT